METSNRDLLLGHLEVIIETIGCDGSLSGCAALLCAVCAAIAGHDEDVLIDIVRPYIDQLTREHFPDLWREINSKNN